MLSNVSRAEAKLEDGAVKHRADRFEIAAVRIKWKANVVEIEAVRNDCKADRNDGEADAVRSVATWYATNGLRFLSEAQAIRG